MISMDRELLRKVLVNATGGCAIQHDGWPCNSCFHSLDISVSSDRLHEMWEAVLAFRGDYEDVIEEYDLPTGIKQENLLQQLLSLIA